MIVAQISDLHIVPPGKKLLGVLDTGFTAKTTIAAINQLDPKPDLVFVTGDLVAGANESAYTLARDLLDELAVTYYVLPGNHDSRSTMLESFGDHATSNEDGFVQYAIEDHPVRFVILDTLLEGQEEGGLSEVQLAWLDRTLANDRSKATVIVMHHPPFETGIWWMDSCGLSGASSLAKVLAGHPEVRQIICGHIHRSISSVWNGINVTVAPATSFEVGFDLAVDATPKVALTRPGFQVHDLSGASWVTHTIFPVSEEKLIDLTKYMPDWPATRQEWVSRKERLDLSRL